MHKPAWSIALDTCKLRTIIWDSLSQQATTAVTLNKEAKQFFPSMQLHFKSVIY